MQNFAAGGSNPKSYKKTRVRQKSLGKDDVKSQRKKTPQTHKKTHGVYMPNVYALYLAVQCSHHHKRYPHE